ncbi:MAG: MGH1-like glycoside hydrolase domain-containing protein [Saccharofermentanales bacterium]
METNSVQIKDIKIFGQTIYDMQFIIKTNGYKGQLQIIASEKFVLFGIELEGKTIVYTGFSDENNSKIDVKTEYLTRINSKNIELHIISDGASADGIEITDISMTVITGFGDFENLRKRKPWAGPSKNFIKSEIDWESILEDSNTYYQSGNMLIEQPTIEQAPNISIMPVCPGIQNIVFFPSKTVKLEYIGQVEGGLVADVAKLHFYTGDSEISLKRDWVRWYPHKIEVGFSGDNIKIAQTSTITWDDQIVCKLVVDTGIKDVTMKSSCNFNGFCAGTIDIFDHDKKPYILAQNGLKVYLAFAAGIADSSDNYKVQNEPLEYTFNAKCSGQVIYLAMAAGMERGLVEKNLFEAIDNPEGVFAKSRKFWNDYFTATVPYFKSDDVSLMKLYFMNCYSHLANCYDIYYEPYLYPYVCPNKTVWKPQWLWNTMWGALSERWLNDLSISEGGIRNELTLNSQLNYQNDLQPLSEYIKNVAFTTNLASAGNNPAATYPLLDLFKRNGDKEFLKSAFKLMCDHEYNISKEDHDGDGLPEYSGNIDEYDQSVRWLGLYVEDNALSDSAESGTEPGTNEWMHFLTHNNQEKSLFGHTKANHIDFCSHLLILRKNLAEIADFYGMHELAGAYREKASKLKNAINEKMWSKEEGFYFDYSLKRKEMNIRWIISGITPLMGMAATDEQAKRVVENLTDTTAMIEWEGKEYKAGKFCWNLYPPCTASVLNKYWRPDEASGYGMGQVTPSSGARYTLEALMNYGYFDEARYLIRKLSEMQTVANDNSLHLPYTYNSLTGKENINHMSQQNAIFNDVIFTYIAGIRFRMDNKFEFMPFDALKDFGAVHIGPFYTKNYPVEIDWDEKRYLVKINEKNYSFPCLTKWVIPVDELEAREKNLLTFEIEISGIPEGDNILELRANKHEEDICLMRIPVQNGYSSKHNIGIDILKGYEFKIDVIIFSSSKNHVDVSMRDVMICSQNTSVSYEMQDINNEMVNDYVIKDLKGEIVKRISGSLK